MPRRDKANDPTGKARTAAERQTLRDHLARSGKVHARDNANPSSRDAEAGAVVDAQMKRDRADRL